LNKVADIFVNFVQSINETQNKFFDLNSDLQKTEQIQEFTLMKNKLSMIEDSIKSNKSIVESVVLYDMALKTKELSDLVGDTVTSEKAVAPLKEMASELTAEQLESRIFDYYSDLSDVSSASDKLVILAEAIDKNIQNENLYESVKPYLEDFEKHIDSFFGRVDSFGSIIKDKILGAFNQLISAVKEKVIPKILAAAKFVADIILKWKLKTVEDMFKFVSAVANLAKAYNMNIKEINMEMPKFEFKSLKLLNFEIPIPNVDAPKTSVTFITHV
jgi:hypothetical protein